MSKIPLLPVTTVLLLLSGCASAASPQQGSASDSYPWLSYSAAGIQRQVQSTFIESSTAATHAQSSLSLRPYAVQPGDTAESLSRKLCRRLSDIKKYNGLDNGSSLKAGQSILLPSKNC